MPLESKGLGGLCCLRSKMGKVFLFFWFVRYNVGDGRKNSEGIIGDLCVSTLVLFVN